MTEWSLSQLLAGLHDDIQHKLETVRKSLGHPVTKGDASEKVWLQLLDTYPRSVIRRRQPILSIAKGCSANKSMW